MTAAQPRLSDYATLIRSTRYAERATSPLGRPVLSLVEGPGWVPGTHL